MKDRSRRRFLGLVGTGGLGGIPGCAEGRGVGQTDDPPTRAITVHMTSEFAFEPADVTIEAGESVVWVNDAPPRQSVTAYDDGVPSPSAYFASGDVGGETRARILYPYVGGIDRGQWFEHTFEQPGTYHYFSIPSESEEMIGRVVVTS